MKYMLYLCILLQGFTVFASELFLDFDISQYSEIHIVKVNTIKRNDTSKNAKSYKLEGTIIESQFGSLKNKDTLTAIFEKNNKEKITSNEEYLLFFKGNGNDLKVDRSRITKLSSKKARSIKSQFSKTLVLKLLKEIASVDVVAGESFGYAGTPSLFFTIAKSLKNKINPDQLNSLLNSDDAIKKALGLWLLANSKSISKKAKEKKLKRFFNDSSKIALSYVGCVVSGASIKDFAKDLAANPNVLSNNSEMNFGNNK